MSRRNQVSTLSAETAAYIAGLIDGEGTITLSRLHANEGRRLVVSIANTEYCLLDFVLEQVGAGKITSKKSSSPAHAPSYCYAISSRQALALLRQVQSFLRSYKRKRADLVLERYLALTPRNGKYSEKQRAERLSFEKTFLSLKFGARGIVTPRLM